MQGQQPLADWVRRALPTKFWLGDIKFFLHQTALRDRVIQPGRTNKKQHVSNQQMRVTWSRKPLCGKRKMVAVERA